MTTGSAQACTTCGRSNCTARPPSFASSQADHRAAARRHSGRRHRLAAFLIVRRLLGARRHGAIELEIEIEQSLAGQRDHFVPSMPGLERELAGKGGGQQCSSSRPACRSKDHRRSPCVEHVRMRAAAEGVVGDREAQEALAPASWPRPTRLQSEFLPPSFRHSAAAFRTAASRRGSAALIRRCASSAGAVDERHGRDVLSRPAAAREDEPRRFRAESRGRQTARTRGPDGRARCKPAARHAE